MLVFKHIAEGAEGQWFERPLWGGVLRLKIRARTETVIKSIREKNKRRKNGQDVYDEAKILDDLYDYLIEDFDGAAEELPDGTARLFDVNLENKKRILYADVPSGEQPIFTWVADRANEQGFEVREDERKN